MNRNARVMVSRLLPILAATLLVGACATQPGPTGSGPGDAAERIQPTVAAHQTQITSLQGQVAALQTTVASPRPTAAAAAPRAPSIPTLMPAVQGIPVDGLSKGLASAKVVLDEYSDFQ